MNLPELTELNVEGMTCSNCAATVRRKLEKDGLSDVNVNFATGEVTFKNSTPLSIDEIASHIDDLGYKVVSKGSDEKKNS
ncbi:MAG: heavy-metal-associated domain-containing protein [Bacteroidia bacterium]